MSNNKTPLENYKQRLSAEVKPAQKALQRLQQEIEAELIEARKSCDHKFSKRQTFYDQCDLCGAMQFTRS